MHLFFATSSSYHLTVMPLHRKFLSVWTRLSGRIGTPFSLTVSVEANSEIRCRLWAILLAIRHSGTSHRVSILSVNQEVQIDPLAGLRLLWKDSTLFPSCLWADLPFSSCCGGFRPHDLCFRLQRYVDLQLCSSLVRHPQARAAEKCSKCSETMPGSMVDGEVHSGVLAAGSSSDKETRCPNTKQFGLSMAHSDAYQLDSNHTLSLERVKRALQQLRVYEHWSKLKKGERVGVGAPFIPSGFVSSHIFWWTDAFYIKVQLLSIPLD